jgi:putative (di)nucleoside polyphosphate hydrolase
MKVRKAVGAVVVKNNEYLLIHKVKNSDHRSIDGYWDFPKGGVEKLDKDLESAIFRELKEETGSNKYRIIDKFKTKICFEFPKAYKYDTQETVMFYIEYLGDREDLKSQDEEIDEVKFFDKDELRTALCHEETCKFLDVIFDKI